MSADWSCLPLLPLRCVLEHLSMEDALAAMSTCRHWRNGVLLYEGRKDKVKLRAKSLQQNIFMTRIFKRYTSKLHIYLDSTENELDAFMNNILPQYFETSNLQELIFIGPSYEQHTRHSIPLLKLKRILTESLVFKHAHSLQKLGFVGCNMSPVTDENDRFSHEQVEYYSRPLLFGQGTAADAVLSSSNSSIMVFSSIQHIIVEYGVISTSALETLGELPRLELVSLNITGRGATGLAPVDWARVQRQRHHRLRVALNIIAVSSKRFKDIIEKVLVDGLALTSFKVLFCKTICMPLLSRVAELSRASLRELVWADSPHDARRPYKHADTHGTYQNNTNNNYSDANPFVILCWQCDRLRRLVIHGYWVWQHDLVGMVRLCKSLRALEVSAVFSQRRHLPHAAGEPPRVLSTHAPIDLDAQCLRKVQELSELELKAASLAQLHPALRSRSSRRDRADYALLETTGPRHHKRDFTEPKMEDIIYAR